MADYGIAVLYALFLWWFSTGVILFLDGLPRWTFKWSMAGATVLLVGALHGVWATSHEETPFGAYAGFSCGLMVWAWNEMAFLMGYATGPVRVACPPGVTGWARFALATKTILHHELAILVSAAVVVAVTWGGTNQVGTVTFFVLWLMRLSTKFNIFLGVPNLSEEFLPSHLEYLKSYFVRRPMNMLFPFTVTASTLFTTYLLHMASTSAPFSATAYSLLSTLSGLAVIEHWFLVVPLPVAALWRWGLRTHDNLRAEPPTWPALCEGCPIVKEAGQDHAADGSSPQLRAWSIPLDGECDPARLRGLLDAIGNGSYGEVESVDGIVRAGARWIRFDLEGMSPVELPPGGQPRHQSRVVAVGHALDGTRLQAAFADCAARPVEPLRREAGGSGH
jgi:putative photosynthetic complex assembly protein 2